MSLALRKSPLPALLAALGLVILYALLASAEPGRAIGAYFLGPFKTSYSFFALLESAAPLLVVALGAGVAFRSGRFNLGGEGQVALGGLAAALLLGHLPAGLQMGATPPLILAFFAAAAAGSFLALLSGLAERWTGAEVLLTSFLVAQAVLLGVDWAIAGPLRDSNSNLLALPSLPPNLLLPRLAPPSPLSGALPLAIGLALFSAWLLRATRAGFELRLHGLSEGFSRAQGLGPGLDLWPLALSGGFHGIAGALVVLGPAGRAIKGLSGGLGWNGIAVALVAGTDPLLSLPSALFFSWLDAGARASSLISDLSPEASAVMKAVALLLVTARFTSTSKTRATPALRHSIASARARPTDTAGKAGA